VLSLKTSVKLILHHKKAIAAVWILLILFPNTMILLADIYRFYTIPTKPTNDVKLVAASLSRNGSASNMSTLTFTTHLIFKSSRPCGTSHAERLAKIATRGL
jgi:hypothetical protein